MEEEYSQAFAEVLEVLNNSTENIKSKIPKRFTDFLEKNEDKDYVVNIDFNEENWEDSLKQEALAILALVYRDYIVTPEEREKLLIEEQEEIRKMEEEIREKYKPENVFKRPDNNIQTEDETDSSKLALTTYKEPFFTRVKNWFKRII